MNIQQIRNHLEQQKGKKGEVAQKIEELDSELSLLSKNLKRHEKALQIIRYVGIETQKQLQYHISDITSMALKSVFEEPYTLNVNFVERRNATECDISFSKDGKEIDPLDASGGGAVDIAAFALRIACWSMQIPRTRNTIILDEPMRFVSAEYQEKASAMISEISKRLGIQFIIVTHNAVLSSYADKVFNVSIRNGKTKIK